MSGALARVYRATALIGLNTLLLLVAVNAVAWAWFHRPGIEEKSPPAEEFLALFPGMDARDIRQLFEETGALRMTHESHTGFREHERSGRFVNVSPAGFRLSAGSHPWPPRRDRYIAFVFGGSTAFGYGVADAQTIASNLQPLLTTALGREVDVYNFGRGQYYSSLERVLFEKLIVSGIRPDAAVFIDGINEDVDENVIDDVFATAFVGDNLRAAIDTTLRRLPIYKALVTMKGSGEDAKASPVASGASSAAAKVDRYSRNKRVIDAVAAAHGVRTYFVWQPSPVYKYDLRYHRFAHENSMAELLRKGLPVYARMAEGTGRSEWGTNLLWCADIQENAREPLYVDSVHYAPAFSKVVARCIADGVRLNQDGMPARDAPARPAAGPS